MSLSLVPEPQPATDCAFSALAAMRCCGCCNCSGIDTSDEQPADQAARLSPIESSAQDEAL